MRKQHVLVSTLGTFYIRTTGHLSGVGQHRHIIRAAFIIYPSSGPRKAKGLCKAPVGISRSSLRHFLYQLPMQAAYSIRERERAERITSSEWVPLSA